MSDDSYENIFGALAVVCDTDDIVALSSDTDTALPDLARMPALRWVDLGGALNVSAAAIERLRERLPDLEIETHEA